MFYYSEDMALKHFNPNFNKLFHYINLWHYLDPCIFHFHLELLHYHNHYYDRLTKIFHCLLHLMDLILKPFLSCWKILVEQLDNFFFYFLVNFAIQYSIFFHTPLSGFPDFLCRILFHICSKLKFLAALFL